MKVQLKASHLQEQLTGNGTAFGLPVLLTDPAIVDICAIAGYDWVSIVAEHSSISLDTISVFQRSAEAAGITVLVHVAHPDHPAILPVLDMGVGGIVCAHVSDRQTAEELVRRVKFPPIGRRGAASAVRSARYGDQDYARYIAEANDRTVAGIVIEDASAILAIDEILATPGIDFAMLGLTDLAQDLGVAGDVSHPEVVAAMLRVIEAAKVAGIVLGMSAKIHSVDRLLSLGFRMIMTPTADTMFLRAALKEHLTAAKQQATEAIASSGSPSKV